MPSSPLVRPSQLARFWELNPITLHTWIRQGRLVAIRSPGNHFRLRVADVRAFCEREGLPIPPFVAPPPKRVVVAGLPEGARRAVARVLKVQGIGLEGSDDPYDALVVAASATLALVALPTTSRSFDTAAAIAALRRSAVGADLLIVAFGATTRAQAAAMSAAGATRVLMRAQGDQLPTVLRDLLAAP